MEYIYIYIYTYLVTSVVIKDSDIYWVGKKLVK
jgi:hypothetical protein